MAHSRTMGPPHSGLGALTHVNMLALRLGRPGSSSSSSRGGGGGGNFAPGGQVNLRPLPLGAGRVSGVEWSGVEGRGAQFEYEWAPQE